MFRWQTVYLAGPITGDRNAKEKFDRLAEVLKKQGATVLNPMLLPTGLSQAAYMDICFAMLRASKIVCFMTGWTESEGSVAEYYYAKKLDKCVYSIDVKTELIERVDIGH